MRLSRWHLFILIFVIHVARQNECNDAKLGYFSRKATILILVPPSRVNCNNQFVTGGRSTT